jgi:hypothetical protein
MFLNSSSYIFSDQPQSLKGSFCEALKGSALFNGCKDQITLYDPLTFAFAERRAYIIPLLDIQLDYLRLAK